MKYLIYCVFLGVASLFLLAACSSKAPDNLGITDGRLAPCPETQNCVSSQATDEAHKIAPLKTSGSAEVVMVDLANTIESMFGAKIIKIEGNYLHAEFTTRIMRFVDDVECYYHEDTGIIDIRSASRIGYSDLNANRKRVEELREKFAQVR